jgi:hypothetical protein
LSFLLYSMIRSRPGTLTPHFRGRIGTGQKGSCDTLGNRGDDDLVETA